MNPVVAAPTQQPRPPDAGPQLNIMNGYVCVCANPGTTGYPIGNTLTKRSISGVNGSTLTGVYEVAGAPPLGLSLVLAAGVLLLAHELGLDVLTTATLCGVLTALIGGATKIGSP